MSSTPSTVSDTKPQSGERESGTELLRILAACGVVMLHYNNELYGGGLTYSAGFNHYFLLLAECLFIPAVDLFIIVFGYYNCRRLSVKVVKPIRLIMQVIVINAAFFLAGCVMSGSFSLSGLLESLLPANYFVVFYSVLYIFSPYINRLLMRLEEKELRLLVLLAFCIFAGFQIIVDILQKASGNTYYGLSPVGMMGGQSGYTIVNFLLCYLIGAWLSLSGKVEKTKTKNVLPVFVLSLAGIFIWSLIDEGTAWAYCNPLVILEAAAVFILFRKMRFRSRVVNTLAKSSFTCYLVHLFIIPYCQVSWAVIQSFPVMLAHIAAVLIGIYLICWVVDFIYNAVMHYITDWIGKKTGEIAVRAEDSRKS